MPYLIIAYDHPNMEKEREAVRQAHRDYLAAQGKQLLASGALLGKDSIEIIGGASLIDTDNKDDAMRFEAEDPYSMAGIRAKVEILPWRLRWWIGEFAPDGHNPSMNTV